VEGCSWVDTGLKPREFRKLKVEKKGSEEREEGSRRAGSQMASERGARGTRKEEALGWECNSLGRRRTGAIVRRRPDVPSAPAGAGPHVMAEGAPLQCRYNVAQSRRGRLGRAEGAEVEVEGLAALCGSRRAGPWGWCFHDEGACPGIAGKPWASCWNMTESCHLRAGVATQSVRLSTGPLNSPATAAALRRRAAKAWA
jgi:hypothetical protein